MSGKAAVLDRQFLFKATNTSWKQVLCMFPFWLFWASHGGADDTFPCILFMPFLSVAPEFPQCIQQYFPDASSAVSSNLAGKFSFYPGPTTVLSLPDIPGENFFSITDSLSEQPIYAWSWGYWISWFFFSFFFNYNFFFEFSFSLNWLPPKRDWYFQWAWPYWFKFQINQLPTPCNSQLPSDPLSGKEVGFEKGGSHFLVTTLYEQNSLGKAAFQSSLSWILPHHSVIYLICRCWNGTVKGQDCASAEV